MADQEAVSQFLAITGTADGDTAKFYIDSAGGDVEQAISQYFESGGAAAGASAMDHEADALPADDPQFTVPDEPEAAAPLASSGGAGPSRPRRSLRTPAQGGVRSLADLGSDDSGGDSDEDGQQGNELYTGGAKSGQVVKARKKDKNSAEDVDGLFDRAREAGAVDGTEADLRSRRGDAAAGGAFSGAARTLAGGDAAAEPAAAAAAPEEAAPAPPQSVVHTITFYADGVFTVNDGEPRKMQDPENAVFMESISRGECPRELDPGSREAPVNVNLVRSHKPYEAPPKPAYVAFSGSGRTLAGPDAEPAAAAAPSPAAAAAPPASAGSASTAWPGPDEGQPTTSIQLRLADGSRLVARFNLSQTVGDIRGFIKASRPDMGGSYRLATAFPAAELTDDSATISGAGLQNAVVVQKPAAGGG